MLFVSAHRPTLRLSWTQLSMIRAPRVSQNLPPPVQPQPSIRASQSSVLLPAISLCASTTSWTPSVLVGAEAVLAVVAQAVVGDDVAAAHEDAGAGVAAHRVVPDPPAVPGIVVDDALVVVLAGCPEVLDREVLDRSRRWRGR